MEIKYLKLIKTIAEEGNISNSANRLFLTQSALSHQLRDVEERLGFKVFLRSRNKWVLTTEGQELHKVAITVLEELDKGLHRIKNIQEGTKGMVRISTECYSFYHGLPGFIQKMSVLYPEIHIDLVVEATHQPVSKILTNELDIAVVTSTPDHNAIEAIPLFEDEIYMVMHKECILSDHSYVLAEDFSKINLIVHSLPLETISVYEHFLKYHKVHPNKIITIPLTEVSLELVRANMGVMCIPKWALQSFKMSEKLIFKPIGKQGLKRTHYLVFRKEDKRKKYFLDFIQNLEEEFI